ncbi:OPT oligopeptide transporter protein-domain-containing protein [Blyttiomyces helicus]|uniref:OPT oligopeptide transporter protein-domain-containing protein n=1 Tax=Blyttiomyces helicus TaxID=388810 RepID=A0A4P9W8C2_9FUNG|nr:OPT oligopeptide transporter protein-domain-containing protein [Blyttiomyces helicus]|eukprot:RKO88769.1 OPT oligopeptide transporter protein-domain-containing protein [Blyttiomyces helicus]
MLLIWTTQLVGFGFAGICRNWLEAPAALWWPSNVVLANILHVIHAKGNDGILADRISLFKKLTTWIIIYEFVPQLFAPYFAHVSIFCVIFGGLKGHLGDHLYYFPVENPANAANIGTGDMYTPWWARVASYLPAIISARIVAPWMYRMNVWDANMYPLTSTVSYNVNGTTYNISAVTVDDVDVQELYENYSPLRLTTYWALSYGFNFIFVTSLLVHTGLFYGKEIVDGFRSSRAEDEDVHIKIMRKYPEVQVSW